MTDLQNFINKPNEIVIYNPLDKNSILLKVAQKVDNIELWHKIIPIMFDIMHKAKGCGLAAPQVGLSYQVFILNIKKPLVFINPKIIEVGKILKEEEEGCLSIPGKKYKVIRPIKIKVEWTNLKGKTEIQTYEGLTSRAWQHEQDHLKGKLINEQST